ncbi:MAG: PaaI family thioesterase [Sneathiella sp.]|uniref:PaaI family thioesterase n=1 Tax=Sneathiella sp. TaxID=1964365 RepID=UPI00300174A3
MTQFKATNENPKEGFSLRGRPSPLTDPWEPIYSREETDRIDVGLWLREAHCNARGFAHGGLISALADNCMGHSCKHVIGGEKSLVTVNLSVDFLGVTRPGAWMEINSEVVKTGRSLCFVQCKVMADGVICARASATFKIV